ncbi:hypothetical protein D3C83_70030 [compost metagenome]
MILAAVLLGDHRRQRRHGCTALALLAIDDFGENARGRAGAQVGHLFTADHQHPAIITGGDAMKCRMQRRGAGRGCGFNPERGNARKAERFDHMGG